MSNLIPELPARGGGFKCQANVTAFTKTFPTRCDCRAENTDLFGLLAVDGTRVEAHEKLYLYCSSLQSK